MGVRLSSRVGVNDFFSDANVKEGMVPTMNNKDPILLLHSYVRQRKS